jgi:hypothetical protein
MYILKILICIDGVTVGPIEAEYHKSSADPEEGASAGGGGRGLVGWNILLIF